jgi:hypothetical protein
VSIKSWFAQKVGLIFSFFGLEKHKPAAVLVTVAVNRNTSGTDCWPMIRTTIAREFLWTGSYFHLAVCAVVRLCNGQMELTIHFSIPKCETSVIEV